MGTTALVLVTPSAGVIPWGATVALTVQVGPTGGSRTVNLQASRDHSTWSTIAALTTNAAGLASLPYTPASNLWYRAVFAGAANLGAATSPVVRVVVRQLNLLRPLPASPARTIVHGTTITFTSTIRPNRPELPQGVAHFVVYQFGPFGWTKVLDRLVPVNRANGVASFAITFNSLGRFYVRSEAAPTPYNANSGWSSVVRYDVT